MDPYALIAQMPNAGQAFSDAYNKGQQQNALAAFAMNPNDPKAQGGAARYDPGAVAQIRQQQQSLNKQQLDDWHKYAGEMAKWADTPAKWDQAVDYLAQQGHPEVLKLKGQFNPAVRAQFMALGGIQDDKPSAGQMVPFTPGGGVARYDPATGQVQVVVQPNDGGHPTGAAAGQPLTDEQIRAMEGGQAGHSSPVPFR